MSNLPGRNIRRRALTERRGVDPAPRSPIPGRTNRRLRVHAKVELPIIGRARTPWQRRDDAHHQAAGVLEVGIEPRLKKPFRRPTV